MALDCRPIEICLAELCCDAAGLQDVRVSVALMSSVSGPAIPTRLGRRGVAAPFIDPDTGVLVTPEAFTFAASVDPGGCLCTCPLPVNVKGSAPGEAVPFNSWYEVTVKRAGRVVLDCARVVIDGDVPYPAGAVCGGVALGDVLVDNVPAAVPPGSGFCVAVLECESVFAAVASDTVAVSAGGTNGHAPSFAVRVDAGSPVEFGSSAAGLSASIRDGSVVAVMIGDGEVVSAALGAGSVTTVKLAAGAVTPAKVDFSGAPVSFAAGSASAPGVVVGAAGYGIYQSAGIVGLAIGGVGLPFHSPSTSIVAVGLNAGNATVAGTATGVYVGVNAGQVSTGAGNVFVGPNAGNTMTTSGSSVVIGSGAGADASVPAATNVTNIGHGATSFGDFTAILGRGGTAGAQGSAVGYLAAAMGGNALALGSQVSASHAGSVAYGRSAAGVSAVSLGTDVVTHGVAAHRHVFGGVDYSAGLNITPGSTSTVGAIMRAPAGYTADYLRLQDSAGTNMMVVASDGTLRTTYLSSLANTGPYVSLGSSMFVTNRTNVANVVLAIGGMTGQTGDLLRLSDPAGATQAKFTSDARFVHGADFGALTNWLMPASTIGAVMRQPAAGTNDFWQMQDTAGTPVLKIASDGTVRTTYLSSLANTGPYVSLGSGLFVTNRTNVGASVVTVKGMTGQTGPLQTWADVAGSALSTVNSDGTLTLPAAVPSVPAAGVALYAAAKRLRVKDASGTISGVQALTVRGTYAAPLAGAVAVVDTDQLLICATGATVTLPTAASMGAGLRFDVKMVGTGTVTVQVSGAGNIDGSATHTLTTQDQSTTFVSDGARWVRV